MASMAPASAAGPCALPGTRPAKGRPSRTSGSQVRHRRVLRVCAAQRNGVCESAEDSGKVTAPVARRSMLAAGIAAATGLSASSALAASGAGGNVAAETAAAAASEAPAQVEKIFFGNGCFWGRQKDFVDVEMLQLGRAPSSISAVAGYAGGPYTARDGRVCYYYAPPETEYERLGHAEVVGMELRGTLEEQKEQLRAFSRTYFSQFRKSPFGQMRQDPQDEGPGYRNLIGVPGGMNSALMDVIAEENKKSMEMVAGQGNLFDRQGNASEDDMINRVYVMDSSKFPFYQAEIYHQFHNGLGKAFPTDYTKGLKKEAVNAGIIKETGCPENPFGIKLPF